MFKDNTGKSDISKLKRQIEALQSKLKEKTDFILAQRNASKEKNKLRRIY